MSPFKIIKRYAGRIIGWSGPSFKERYRKRRERDMKRSPKALPESKPKQLELEGLDIIEADYYEIRVPPTNPGECQIYITCERLYSLKAKISTLTSNGHTEFFVTAYKRVEEYKVSTKIRVEAEPFTSRF